MTTEPTFDEPYEYTDFANGTLTIKPDSVGKFVSISSYERGGPVYVRAADAPEVAAQVLAAAKAADADSVPPSRPERCESAAPLGSLWPTCSQPAGHDGQHETVSGYRWPTA